MKRFPIIILIISLLSGCFLTPEYYQINYSKITFVNETALDEGENIDLASQKNGRILDLTSIGNSMIVYGYALLGWSSSPGGAVIDELLVTEEITLYAVWGAKTSYAIGDRGPTGGWIFKIDSGTYFETAKSDISDSWIDLNNNYPTGGYSIPTKSLLLDMYSNLYQSNLGGFSAEKYWASEAAAINFVVDFSDGYIYFSPEENEFKTRPYRTFTL